MVTQLRLFIKKSYSSIGAIQEQTLYLHRDYQGSILAISNETGAIVEKRLFDAWGAIVKVQDDAGNVLNGLTILDRGYTRHEHLQSVGLIHMNGRLYDPKLHRFLQPDNFVQDPGNTQNYNRYGYVLNNPLKYTDPSGEFKINWNDIIAGVAIVVGTVLSFVPGGATIGVPLIGAGVAHFSAAYAEYTKTGDWNAASNNAGISFSTTVTTDFGYDDSKNHIPGVIQNDPIVDLDVISDIWNSPMTRLVVPDRIYISLSYNANVYVGTATDFSLNWITRGNDASLIPYSITTVAGTAGMVNGGVGISAGGGYYPTMDMRSLPNGAASNAMLGWSYTGTAFGAADGGRVSLTGSVGINGTPLNPIGLSWITGGASVGFGTPGVGVYGGASYSTPSFGTKKEF